MGITTGSVVKVLTPGDGVRRCSEWTAADEMGECDGEEVRIVIAYLAPELYGPGQEKNRISAPSPYEIQKQFQTRPAPIPVYHPIS